MGIYCKQVGQDISLSSHDNDSFQSLDEPSMETDVSEYYYCSLGLVYDPVNQICTCYSTGGDENKVIKCNKMSGTACIKTGYWYGTIDNGA